MTRPCIPLSPGDSPLPRLLRYTWAAPTTMVGLLAGTLTLCTGGRAQVRRGAVEFYGGFARWLAEKWGFSAMTLGHVIIGQRHMVPRILPRPRAGPRAAGRALGRRVHPGVFARERRRLVRRVAITISTTGSNATPAGLAAKGTSVAANSSPDESDLGSNPYGPPSVDLGDLASDTPAAGSPAAVRHALIRRERAVKRVAWICLLLAIVRLPAAGGSLFFLTLSTIRALGHEPLNIDWPPAMPTGMVLARMTFRHVGFFALYVALLLGLRGLRCVGSLDDGGPFAAVSVHAPIRV